VSRLESSPEKVVQLGPLSDIATAQLLVSIAPPGFRVDEVTSRPYATREDAYAEIAATPAVRELKGHPKVRALRRYCCTAFVCGTESSGVHH
jgi:hypothetical protein